MVRKDYSHDEDQFIASAWLTAQDGMLPYRDYTYFHAPYLVFIYAVLFWMAGETPLFTARIFSSLCGSASIFLVFFLVLDFFRHSIHSSRSGRDQPIWFGYLIAAEIALLYLVNPLTAAATGFSWNHDVMTLFMLLGFGAAYLALDRAHPRLLLFASGLFLALAVGVRSSAVTVLPVYLLAVWFFPIQRSIKKSVLSIVAWISGFLVGMLPMLVLFMLAPQQFLFGNLEYALLNTRYRMDVPVLYDGNVAIYGPSSLVDKIDYLMKNILNQPANLFVLLLMAVFGWTVLGVAIRRGWVPSYYALLFLLLTPFAAIGSFLPSPSWIQYFFIPLPFILLAVAFGLNVSVRNKQFQAIWLVVILFWVVVLSHAFHFQDYRRIGFLRYPELWRPRVIHQVGQQIREIVGEQGSVFTLSPLYLLEGHLEIDPRFATGTFAYRTGAFLTSQERQFHNIVSADDLEGFLDANPPDGIFLGLDPLLDVPIRAYAKSRGYQEFIFTPRLSLWVKSP